MQNRETIPELPADVRRLIEEHRVSYEVSPHYIVLEEHPVGAAATIRRIQDGIDVDIYGVNTSQHSWPPPEYGLAYRTLQQLAETILAKNADTCSIELVPFRSTVILDTKAHFQPLSFLRITIRHRGGLADPAGDSERLTLQEIENRLSGWGLKAGGSHA